MLDSVILAFVVSASCPSTAQFTGNCSHGSITSDGADLVGEIDGSDNSIESDGGGTDEPDDTISYCGRRTNKLCDFEFTITPPPASAVNISDLAHFTASPGSIVTEPSGWAILDLPLNAYSTATPHTVDGTLLGQPATVRFTPIAWTWDYGDGTTARTTTGGAPWSELGLTEFDATPTSHTYTTRATRTLSLTTEFHAEYRLNDGPWIPITGTLTLPATAPITLRTVTAHTALVAHDCRATPHGPGC
jgi:hypothetical protein